MPPLRVIAPALSALLAACVVLLGLAAVSPRVHAELCAQIGQGATHDHAHDHGDHAHADHARSDATDAHPEADLPATGDHACAVTLFAAGCETPVVFQLCPPLALHAEGVASFTELLLSRTPRGPERVCGPPALA